MVQFPDSYDDPRIVAVDFDAMPGGDLRVIVIGDADERVLDDFLDVVVVWFRDLPDIFRSGSHGRREPLWPWINRDNRQLDRSITWTAAAPFCAGHELHDFHIFSLRLSREMRLAVFAGACPRHGRPRERELDHSAASHNVLSSMGDLSNLGRDAQDHERPRTTPICRQFEARSEAPFSLARI